MVAVALPANDLVGIQLPGKSWEVVRKVGRGSDATGGNYSYPYIVVDKDGNEAFLKVFDFSQARNAPDEALAIQGMINAYVHERELLKRCGIKGVDRVVRAIDSGKIDSSSAPGGMIFYLVFEQATADARQLMDKMRHLDVAWRLCTLHHISVALHQLHTADIAHQDVKPSNVLWFGARGSKLGDLGRACCKDLPAPHMEENIPGDPEYAPPELLYNQINPDWRGRRLSCDLYLLGSMVVYLFTNQATTHLLVSKLPESLRPASWGDTYSSALPFLREAFHQALEAFAAHISDPKLQEDLVPAVKQLCDPDPSLRGHPSNRSRFLNQYSLQQYMSLFNLLAQRAQIAGL